MEITIEEVKAIVGGLYLDVMLRDKNIKVLTAELNRIADESAHKVSKGSGKWPRRTELGRRRKLKLFTKS
jgi:hypothetical protein